MFEKVLHSIIIHFFSHSPFPLPCQSRRLAATCLVSIPLVCIWGAVGLYSSLELQPQLSAFVLLLLAYTIIGAVIAPKLRDITNKPHKQYGSVFHTQGIFFLLSISLLAVYVVFVIKMWKSFSFFLSLSLWARYPHGMLFCHKNVNFAHCLSAIYC